MTDRNGNTTFGDWANVTKAINSIGATQDRNERRARTQKKEQERMAVDAKVQELNSGEIDGLSFEPSTKIEHMAVAAFARQKKTSDEGKAYLKQRVLDGATKEFAKIQEAKKLIAAKAKDDPDGALDIGVELLNGMNNAYCAERNGKTVTLYHKEEGEQTPMQDVTVEDMMAELDKIQQKDHFKLYYANKKDIQQQNEKYTFNPQKITNAKGDRVIEMINRLHPDTREMERLFFDEDGNQMDTSMDELKKEGFRFTTLKEMKAQKKAEAEAEQKQRKQKMDTMKFIGTQLKVKQEKGDEFEELLNGNAEPAMSLYAQVLSIAEGKGNDHEKNLAATYLQLMNELFPELEQQAKGAVETKGDQGGGGGPDLAITPEQDAAIRAKMDGGQPQNAPTIPQQGGAMPPSNTGQPAVPTFSPSQDFTNQFGQNNNIDGTVVPVSLDDVGGALKDSASGAASKVKNFAMDLMQGHTPDEKEKARQMYLGQ